MEWLISELGEPAARALLARIADAEQIWPRVGVEAAAFARHVVDTIRADADVRDLPASMAALHLSDLYLAYACARGNPAAQRIFDQRFLLPIGPYLRSIDGSETFADEVRQDLRSKLFVPSADGVAKIGTYTGRGPLGGWVRVAAVRAARNIKRGDKPRVDVSDEQLGGLLADNASPELAYLKTRSARLFRDTFESVLKGLGTREQAILRLTYVERMSSQDIGRMYGVSGAAVRVWLKKVRDDVVDLVRAGLGTQLAGDTEELRELVGLVESRFELTLSRVLDGDDGA